MATKKTSRQELKEKKILFWLQNEKWKDWKSVKSEFCKSSHSSGTLHSPYIPDNREFSVFGQLVECGGISTVYIWWNVMAICIVLGTVYSLVSELIDTIVWVLCTSYWLHSTTLNIYKKTLHSMKVRISEDTLLQSFSCLKYMCGYRAVISKCDQLFSSWPLLPKTTCLQFTNTCSKITDKLLLFSPIIKTKS
jgi:hypothetical protein